MKYFIIKSNYNIKHKFYIYDNSNTYDLQLFLEIAYIAIDLLYL